jgi:hypothetical protein
MATSSRASITTKRSQRLIVSISFAFACKYADYDIKWTLRKNISSLNSTEIDLRINPSRQSTKLIVGGNQLDYGYYTATYNITVNERLPTTTITTTMTTSTFVGHIQITIIPSDLQVNLAESRVHRVILGNRHQFFLSPRLFTFDPDMLAPIETFKYRFYCQPYQSIFFRDFLDAKSQIGTMDLIEMKKLNLNNFTVDYTSRQNIKCFQSTGKITFFFNFFFYFRRFFFHYYFIIFLNGEF